MIQNNIFFEEALATGWHPNGDPKYFIEESIELSNYIDSCSSMLFKTSYVIANESFIGNVWELLKAFIQKLIEKIIGVFDAIITKLRMLIKLGPSVLLKLNKIKQLPNKPFSKLTVEDVKRANGIISEAGLIDYSVNLDNKTYLDVLSDQFNWKVYSVSNAVSTVFTGYDLAVDTMATLFLIGGNFLNPALLVGARTLGFILSKFIDGKLYSDENPFDVYVYSVPAENRRSILSSDLFNKDFCSIIENAIILRQEATNDEMVNDIIELMGAKTFVNDNYVLNSDLIYKLVGAAYFANATEIKIADCTPTTFDRQLEELNSFNRNFSKAKIIFKKKKKEYENLVNRLKAKADRIADTLYGTNPAVAKNEEMQSLINKINNDIDVVKTVAGIHINCMGLVLNNIAKCMTYENAMITAYIDTTSEYFKDTVLFGLFTVDKVRGVGQHYTGVNYLNKK